MTLPYVMEGLEERARMLHEAYALSSGQKLCDIWSSALRLDVSTRVHYILEHLGLLPLGAVEGVQSKFVLSLMLF